MTPRSIRRAQERKAIKAARNAERLSALEIKAPEIHVPAIDLAETTPEPPARPRFEQSQATQESLCWKHEPLSDSPASPILFPLSEAQLAANRANAQLSSGPTSPEGKTKSSLNAVKTGLTGRTVLLPSDDAPAYERHLRAYANDFSPVGARETDLVQSIADTAWRLKRIPCLEAAIFAQGYVEFADEFNQHEAPLRASMIEVQTFIKYEKQLRNLQLQESRLVRRREKEMQELRHLQQERRSKQQEALETVSKLYLAAQETGQSFEPAADGFVFSIDQIEQHLNRLAARNIARRPISRAINSKAEAERIVEQAA